jgi:hypothetical protein
MTALAISELRGAWNPHVLMYIPVPVLRARPNWHRSFHFSNQLLSNHESAQTRAPRRI